MTHASKFHPAKLPHLMIIWLSQKNLSKRHSMDSQNTVKHMSTIGKMLYMQQKEHQLDWLPSCQLERERLALMSLSNATLTCNSSKISAKPLVMKIAVMVWNAVKTMSVPVIAVERCPRVALSSANLYLKAAIARERSLPRLTTVI